MEFNNKFGQIRNVAIVFACAVLGLYLFVFINSKLSGDPSDWGVFGDYFGGVLNPVISFLNLLLTYYIAQMINDFTKTENRKQLLTQNKIIKSQLRYDALRDYQKEINFGFQKLFEATNTIENIRDHLNRAIETTISFHQTYDHLFTENPQFHTRLVSDFRTSLQKINESIALGLISSHRLNRGEIETILDPLNNSKDSMISNLNREIIRKLDQNLV